MVVSIDTKRLKFSYLFKTLFLSGFILIFTLSGYAQTKVRVAVAASLMLPLEEIKLAFEKENPGIQVELIGGSSGNLTTQIKNGAPFHIFLSANWDFPQELFHQGFAAQNPQIINYGKLVIWTRTRVAPEEITNYLLSTNVKAIAIANPKLAPYGWTAQDWLTRKGIWEDVESKMIFGQSISQVNQYIYSGNVDVAFTAISAKNADKLKKKGFWLIIENDEFQVPNGGVILKHEVQKNEKIAGLFFNYLLKNSALKIFQKYGFTPNSTAK